MASRYKNKPLCLFLDLNKKKVVKTTQSKSVSIDIYARFSKYFLSKAILKLI